MSGSAGRLYAQRYVVLQLLVQALTDLAAGQELAFAPGERRFVDLEGHRDRRFINRQGRQRVRVRAIADGIGDLQIVNAAENNDIPGPGLHQWAVVRDREIRTGP